VVCHATELAAVLQSKLRAKRSGRRASGACSRARSGVDRLVRAFRDLRRSGEWHGRKPKQDRKAEASCGGLSSNDDIAIAGTSQHSIRQGADRFIDHPE